MASRVQPFPTHFQRRLPKKVKGHRQNTDFSYSLALQALSSYRRQVTCNPRGLSKLVGEDPRTVLSIYDPLPHLSPYFSAPTLYKLPKEAHHDGISYTFFHFRICRDHCGLFS